MSTKTTENSAEQMKEYLISKIRKIVVDEKFKLDAYFLCGAPVSPPNSDLQKAGEKYLEMIDSGKLDEEVTKKLIAEMEAVLTTEPKVQVVGDLVDNRNAIREVFDKREFL